MAEVAGNEAALWERSSVSGEHRGGFLADEAIRPCEVSSAPLPFACGKRAENRPFPRSEKGQILVSRPAAQMLPFCPKLLSLLYQGEPLGSPPPEDPGSNGDREEASTSAASQLVLRPSELDFEFPYFPQSQSARFVLMQVTRTERHSSHSQQHPRKIHLGLARISLIQEVWWLNVTAYF